MSEPEIGDIMCYAGIYVVFTRRENERVFWGTVISDDCDQLPIGTHSCFSLEMYSIKKVTIILQDADIDVDTAYQKEMDDGE